ncbi:hypothetical protein HPB50_024053 [Hyalomma asiaticum]|uniref:Uncharacterized protein n=1 Tax=Hyalomma asiaticum TaxID=266040 RepID=A0ACB7SQK6_HYAAI|nr:hypothetical protein HPB50_024053 [Hyalomma asiaticum]
MASTFMLSVCYLLLALLLAGHGGVLISADSQLVAACGQECGGFVGVECVAKCHCVFYPLSDYGVCLSRSMNETHLP